MGRDRARAVCGCAAILAWLVLHACSGAVEFEAADGQHQDGHRGAGGTAEPDAGGAIDGSGAVDAADATSGAGGPDSSDADAAQQPDAADGSCGASNAVALAQDMPGLFGALISDGHAYYANPTLGTISRVSLAGGAPDLVATGQAYVRGIAADEAHSDAGRSARSLGTGGSAASSSTSPACTVRSHAR
jgi:hypothetical protein